MKRLTVGSDPAPSELRSWLAFKERMVLPVDSFADKIPHEILSKAEDAHLLLAPSMGQHYTATADYWCGRTSSCMVENLRILNELDDNEDPAEHYIAMRLKGGAWNLRNPSGESMYYLGNLCAPDNRLKEKFGYDTGKRLEEAAGFTKDDVRSLRDDPEWVHEVFRKSGIPASIRANNPVVYYSRFSNGVQHIILLTGVLTIQGHLWFLVHNPAPNSAAMLRSFPKNGNWADVNQFDLIEFQTGNWALGLGAIGLIRAGRFFANHHKVGGAYFYESGDGNSAKGRYSLNLNPTALREELLLTSVRKPLFHFPMDLGRDTPLSMFSAAERLPLFGEEKPTAGGFYPIGMEGRLHAGIHLRNPGATDRAVRAMAPGDVVAIRMGARGNASQHDKVQAMQRNWTNFVLLRHELELGKEGRDVKPFYSLYMHLAPPSWWRVSGGAARDEAIDVPWLRRWSQARNGVLLKIAENASISDDHPVGTSLYLDTPLPEGILEDQFRITVEDGAGFRKVVACSSDPEKSEKLQISVPLSTSLADATWIYLPPPPHLKLICQALENGEALFLDGHFLSVENGETIGLISPFNSGVPEIPPKGSASPATQVEMSKSFLHWEAFAAEAKIFQDVAAAIDSAEGAFEILDAPSDPTELAEKLKGLLVGGEGAFPEPLTDTTPNQDFPKNLVDFFESSSKGSLDQVVVRFDVSSMPKPSEFRSKSHPDGLESYDILVHFVRKAPDAKPGETAALQLVGEDRLIDLTDADWSGGPVEKMVEFVPLGDFSLGDIEQIGLEWESRLLVVARKQEGGDWASFLKRTQPLWRNLIVNHDSEWTPDIAKELILPEEKDQISPTDLGWWSAESKVLKADGTLPDSVDGLPKGIPTGLGDGKHIAAIHPVSLKWMLELGHRNPAVHPMRFRNSWTRDNIPQADRSKYPTAMTVLGHADSVQYVAGSPVRVLVIDQFYNASGKRGSARLRLEHSQGSAPPLDLEIPFDDKGVARGDLHPDVWGSWKLQYLEGEDTPAAGSSPVDLEFIPPEIDETLLERSVHQPLGTISPDVYRWTIPWKPGVDGDRLHGVVELLLKVAGKVSPTGIGVIATTIPKPEPKAKLNPEKGWKLDGDWISLSPPEKKDKGQTPGKITDNFPLSEWVDAGLKDEIRLHARLARSIQDLRMSAGAFKVGKLESNGTECVLKAADAARADALENFALRTGLFSRVELEVLEVVVAKKTSKVHQVRLAVEPGNLSHSLVEFNLGPALDCLVQNGLAGLGETADFLKGTAAKTSGILSKVEAVSAIVPQGDKVGGLAKEGGDAASKVASTDTKIEYTVGFHLVPSHFLNLSDRNGDPEGPEGSDTLLEPSEFAFLASWPSFFKPLSVDASKAEGLLDQGVAMVGEKLGLPASAPTPSIPRTSNLGFQSSHVLGTLGGIRFGVPTLRQELPSKNNPSHTLILTCPVTGSSADWKKVGVRLLAKSNGEALSVPGTISPSTASFRLDWPKEPPEILQATLDGYPLLKIQDDPEKVVSTPASLSVAIPLQPAWSDSTPVLSLVKGALTMTLWVPGLKGSNPANSTPTTGADKVEVELRNPSGDSLTVHRTGFKKDIGYTYADTFFHASASAPGFTKNPEGAYTVLFRVGSGSKRFGFEWKAGKLSASSEIRVFDSEEESNQELADG